MIYYLEMWDQVRGLWTRTLNQNNLFTFTQGGRNPNITVYTTDNELQGVYQMRLMGKFSPNTNF